MTVFQDVIRGEMRFDHEVVDDFVLLRSDGSPTYHLASTVDDVDYEITHVARGEDLLSSTPKHIQLSRAMGKDAPRYAHMPLLFGPDGRKLSKRHGVTSVGAYRDAGYLPEAMFNYLASLGWSYDPETAIFSVEQAISRFTLEDVSKNPAIFDPEKLTWMNGEYIRALDREDFATRVRAFLEEGLDRSLSRDEWQRFLILSAEIQERVKTLTETADLAAFLFVEELSYDERSWSKVMTEETAPVVLRRARRVLAEVEPWEAEVIEGALRAMLDELELSPRRGLQPVRVAVTGSHVSPPLFESLEALGRSRTLARLDRAARLL
jgi:glutamyl-tRNA synthetase